MYRFYSSRYIPIPRHKFISTFQPLIDSHHRVHNYLRISLTEKCNFRCQYCMPEDGIQLSQRDSYLTLRETQRLSYIFVKYCGIDKIRLTGGEPTIDKKLYPLLQYLNELREHGLKTVALTTNGLNLKKNALNLKSLGLDRVNISLDSMRVDRFELITRRKGLNLVYQGIQAAIEAEFQAVKVNCVIIKDLNDDELCEFTKLAQLFPIEVRFIEFMPFAGNKWTSERMVSYKEMLQIIKYNYPNLEKVSTSINDVSKVYKEPTMLGSIGFISSMSDNFCSGCNRIRLTSDGNLKVCLFARDETSLRDLMRNSASDIEIAEAIARSLKSKKARHPGSSALQDTTWRPMVKIGVRYYHSSGENSDTSDFSHITDRGEAKMVNINSKPKVKRVAIAQGTIFVGNLVLNKLQKQNMTKGDIISVSRVAGILGAKWTSHLIPLCHLIALDHISVDIEPCHKTGVLNVIATAEAYHNTGVEMESLVAVTVTLLTLYDMCKSLNKLMIISDVKLLSKNKYKCST